MEFDGHVARIVSEGVELELFVVPWDSRIFGFPVAQIKRITTNRLCNPADGMRQLRSWLDRENVQLASCRLASDSLRESMLLEAHGFRFVEMVYGPTLSPIPAIERLDDDLIIDEARLDDLPAIEAIAASAFATGRFVLDWRLDGNASHRRYRAWVRNSFDDAGQRVLKASIDNNVVGFFIVENRAGNSVYWHLTAISPAWQGKGLGKRLWTAMSARHRAEGLERIDTTISAHNTRVMNICARLGFRFSAPQITFHWIRE